MTQMINAKIDDLKQYGYLVHDFFENQPISIKEENQPVMNSEEATVGKEPERKSTFQTLAKDDEFSNISSFKKLPKANEKSSFQSMTKENETSVFENNSNQQQPSNEIQLDNLDIIRQGLNIPSDNVQENKSAVMLAIASGEERDIEFAKIALQAIPDDDLEKATLTQKLQEIIDMQSPTVNHENEIQEIQNQLVEAQKDIIRLNNRQGEITNRLREIRDMENQLKNQPAMISTTLGFSMNPDNQKKSEAAIQKVLQMASPQSVGYAIL